MCILFNRLYFIVFLLVRMNNKKFKVKRENKNDNKFIFYITITKCIYMYFLLFFYILKYIQYKYL